MRDLNWYLIASSLRDFIRSYAYNDGTKLFAYLVDRDSFKVNIGKGIAGEFPRLDILLGDETPLDDTKQSAIIGANIELWLDLYVKGEEDGINDNGDILYKQAYKSEKELVQRFTEFNKLIQKNYGIGTNFKVTGILSDGDLSAPASIQHRIMIEIEWRR